MLRQPVKKDAKDKVDPTEEYVNSLFPHHGNGDEDDEHDENRCKCKLRCERTVPNIFLCL